VGKGTQSERVAIVSLVDWLLLPEGGTLPFLRRHVLLPPAVIAEIYGLPANARGRCAFRRLWYASIVTVGFSRGYARAAWALRGRRAWVPLPNGPAALIR
jgi:hypothetical protein